MNRQSPHYLLRSAVVLGMLLGISLAVHPAPLAAAAPASPAQAPCGPHVYFDLEHDSGDTAGHYTALADLVVSELGGSFEQKYGPLSAAALAGYNVLLVADPEYAFSQSEIDAVHDFLLGGGRLVVLGEWGTWMNTAAANALLAGAGIYISFNRTWCEIRPTTTAILPGRSSTGLPTTP